MDRAKHAPALRGPRLRALISRIVEEAPNVRTFTLDLPPGRVLRFLPGQCVALRLASEDPPRVYSISSSPLHPDQIEITLSRFGPLAERLFSFGGGEEVLLEGPLGRWFYEDALPHAVLIAAGSGVAPFRSMIRYVLDKGLPGKLTLLYCARDPASILYRKELETFSERGVRVYVTLTRPGGAGEQAWSGPTGRLDAETVRRLVRDFKRTCYFLCGPPAFMDAMGKGLRALGVASADLRYGRWGSE